LESQASLSTPAGLWSLIAAEEGGGVPGCRVCDVTCRVNPEATTSSTISSSSLSWCYVLGRVRDGIKWRGWVTEADLIKHAPDVTLPPSLAATRDSVDQVWLYVLLLFCCKSWFEVREPRVFVKLESCASSGAGGVVSGPGRV
jgi:hypothetical protein